MKDTVNEMLNDISKKRDRIKMIHIDDIHANKKNSDFPMCDIEAMALSLRICGQIDPCVVVKDGDDYTLISGERRWRAAKLNVSQGYKEWEELACIVREYESEQDEIMLIAANGARESIPVSKKIAITKKVLEHYTQAKEHNEVPAGTKKRAWISAVTGYSERSVQNYLNQIENQKTNRKETNERNVFLTSLEDRIMHKLQTKAKVTDTYIKVNYHNTEDLNRILEIMGLLEEAL